jgi:hypothetical protein
VDSWKSQFTYIVHSRAHHPPSQPTIAAQLLGEPAAGEPYNHDSDATKSQENPRVLTINMYCITSLGIEIKLKSAFF